MQTGTFYIASSIRNIPQVRSCAADLQDRGMRWCNDYAWSSYEQVIEENDIKGEKASENTLTAMASRDICGAIGASLFVLVMCPQYTMRGSFVEMGARVGNHRECHVVLNGYKDMFFFHHPNVVTHATWRDFMLALFPFEGYIPSSEGDTEVHLEAETEGDEQ